MGEGGEIKERGAGRKSESGRGEGRKCGGVEVGSRKAGAGARAGIQEPAASRRGKENDNSLDIKCLPPLPVPSLQLVLASV